MKNKRILVPIDFSEVSETVVKTAIFVADKGAMSVSFLHIQTDKSPKDALEKLKQLAGGLDTKSSVQFDFSVKQGNVIDEITKVTNNDKYSLMIVGSHGYKGLREKLFGADILKLLKNVSIPALTVQKDFEHAKADFSTILFPVSSHESFMHQIKVTIEFALLFNSTIHLYSVEKPGVEFSDNIKKNLATAKAEFENHSVAFQKVKEPQSSFSVGYSKQIMDYASRQNMSLIAIMANSTKEHYYIADADKESMLTNSACIPILSTNNKVEI
jgi:nucleotide-binding universal stress UspA family protein